MCGSFRPSSIAKPARKPSHAQIEQRQRAKDEAPRRIIGYYTLSMEGLHDLEGVGEFRVGIMHAVFVIVILVAVIAVIRTPFNVVKERSHLLLECPHLCRRTWLLAYSIGRARGLVQVDIGFGDAVSPAPIEVEFPTLLDLPAPRLRAYPPETVIAEKFEAMVTLGMANSRMKDFYDLYTLARTFPFDGQLLRQALQTTLDRRQTPLPTSIPLALTMEFAQDPTKHTQWNAFIRKSQLMNQAPALADVIDILTKFVWPAAMAAQDQQHFAHFWDTEALIWVANGIKE